MSVIVRELIMKLIWKRKNGLFNLIPECPIVSMIQFVVLFFTLEVLNLCCCFCLRSITRVMNPFSHSWLLCNAYLHV